MGGGGGGGVGVGVGVGGGDSSSGSGGDGASTYRKTRQKRSGKDKSKYRSDASAAMNDGGSVAGGICAQVQASKLKSWHDLFLVTQKRKKRKSKNKFKAKSKPYKCHNNYPTKKKNGKITLFPFHSLCLSLSLSRSMTYEHIYYIRIIMF